MRPRIILMAALMSALLLLPAGAGLAHPDAINDGAVHDNKHALHDFSHEGDSEGHIPQDKNYGFTLVGRDTLGGITDGRYTDVWADGNGYAYVGTFQEPTCDRSGVYISDIRNPAKPTTVNMIKSPPDTRVNDVKTITLPGGRTVLIHTLEPCGTVPGTGATKGQGGIALYDVSDPTRPSALKLNFLSTPVHNTYPWTDANTQRSYLIVTLDEGARDTVFVDITKPQSPEVLSTVGLPDWPGAQDDQVTMGSFAASFNHDVWIADVGKGRQHSYQAVVSYWDAGFVTLDVNNPASPKFVDDSTYPDPDPITGFSPPEGNGHAAVYSTDQSMIFAGDEDFSASRTSFRITEGPNAGPYEAVEGAFTKPIAELEDNSMNGSSTYLGLACDPSADLPDAVEDGDPLTDEIAVIQRGVCRFDTKAQTALNNGYDGFVVFNDAARGDQLVLMGGDSRDIPGVFVGHSTGLAIFNVNDASALSIGQSGAATATTVEFDGFGYFHLLDRTSLAERGYYAPAQVYDPEFASGFGDLTMHNVEGDPSQGDVAFISWYSLGMRAVRTGTGASIVPPTNPDGTANWDAATPTVDDYYGQNVTEIGRWIAPKGSNFWGVHVTTVDGEQYVLASDRNTGLHVFSFSEGKTRKRP